MPRKATRCVSVNNRNNLECALAEAAYMTGLERNGDVVRMASYAPLFANTEAWQWKPDLIWVNSLGVCLTPNYYVQKLFANNRRRRHACRCNWMRRRAQNFSPPPLGTMRLGN